MKSILALIFAVSTFAAASLNAQVSCPNGFSTSGNCSEGQNGNLAFKETGSFNGTSPSLSGSTVDFVPSGANHIALSLNYQSAVNVQSFTSTFTFVPNNDNLTFVLQNDNICTGSTCFTGKNFSSGAGCEAGFFQAFSGNSAVNNIFALEFDNWSYLGSAQSFTYSSVQIYQAGQSPCNPNDSGPNYTLIPKISTSPVALNNPPASQGSPSGDTFSATITYDGSNVTLNLFDLTAGGACPGAKCFTHTWTGVNIPSLVGGNTAYVGLTAGTGETSTAPLLIKSFSYGTGAAPPPPPPVAATPTFSPAAGTYTFAQPIIISDTTAGANIYYTIDGSAPTPSSTKYVSAITVGSTETLQAIAIATGYTNSPIASAAYSINMGPALSIPAQSIPIVIQTNGAPINGTLSIPTQTPTP